MSTPELWDGIDLADKARSAIFQALKGGRLKKRKTCQVCGRATHLEAHHNNYFSDPLDIIWVCRRGCHGVLDKLRRERESSVQNYPLVERRNKWVPK